MTIGRSNRQGFQHARSCKSFWLFGFIVGIASGGFATPASAQPTSPPPAQVASAPQRDLTEFEGHYEYRDGETLFIVVHAGRLVAVLGGTPYLLRAAGTDAFTNPSGDAIPFRRDASGRITAFSEAGDTFARLSSTVAADARRLLEARPPGPDGVPVVYRYEPPPQLPDGIPTGAAGPGTLSVDVAERLVSGVVNGTSPNVRSILVYHKGALILEEYFYGYDRTRPHQMRSFTKSVISLLAGAAVDRGLLRADEPVLARLGYSAYANPDPRKAQVTLAHLLSNQSGLACDDRDGASPGSEVKLYETADWVKAFVDLPMVADPGTVGRYCSAGFFTVSRIIERVAGKPLAEFAQEALFEPLGIGRDDWKWYLALDRSERNEFGQIYLRPRDMLKLGLLIQQRGEWEGRRVVSAAWIDAATAHTSRIDDSDYGLGIWHRWYGVQTPEGRRRVDTIMLSGNGGQKVFLVPSLDLIVAATGVAFFVDSPVNQMLAAVLLPALLSDASSGDRR
jgi:CubicO group peptidase (beta-lactamase class C family)